MNIARGESFCSKHGSKIRDLDIVSSIVLNALFTMQYRSITFWQTNSVIRDLLWVSIVLQLFKKYFIAMKLHHYYINRASGQFSLLHVPNTYSLCPPINVVTCYFKVFRSNMCTHFLVLMCSACLAHFIILNLTGAINLSKEYLKASSSVFPFSYFLFYHYRTLKILLRTCLKFSPSFQS